MKKQTSKFIAFSKNAQAKFKLMIVAALLSGLFAACGDANSSESSSAPDNTAYLATDEPEPAAATNDGIGVGPISHVDLGAGIDKSLAEKGKIVFEAKCTACHNTDASRKVGPGLADVTERRKPEWVMNMILAPEKMVQEDPVARELLAEYMAPMANQSLTEDEARSILEYFRQNDANN